MRGIVVGVFRGGPSSEHEVSLKTGQTMLSALKTEKYTARDIFIDKEGVWHERGRPTAPHKVLPSIDVAVIALHGAYGEDGDIQKLLTSFGVPFTGSSAYGSYLAMHKVLAKEKIKEAGITTPRYMLIEREEDIDSLVYEIVRTFHQPVMVKPVLGGSSIGASLIAGQAPLAKAIKELLPHSPQGVLIEERILGTEATVGVLEDFRGETLYALPPVEIIPSPEHVFFNHEAKYNGKTKELCPGNFRKTITEELKDLARKAHNALHASHYSRSDFVVSPRGIYFLETNTLPAVTPTSLFTKGLDAVGCSLPQFLDHIISRARNAP